MLAGEPCGAYTGDVGRVGRFGPLFGESARFTASCVRCLTVQILCKDNKNLSYGEIFSRFFQIIFSGICIHSVPGCFTET